MRFRNLLGEALIGSLFLQLFALITPLLSQTVIDKVLVHEGWSTLDVLVFGLAVVSIFEVLLHRLTGPNDGSATNLATWTVGGVVKPGKR